MGLEYYLKEKPMAMERGQTVKLVYRNPALNFNDFPGDKGLGIEIPNNDINRAILKNPERFETYGQKATREFEGFEVRYSGWVLMSGTLVVQKADKEKYSCWLRGDIGNLGKEHREKFITDSSSFVEYKQFVNKANYDPLTDDYGCPKVFNPDFFKDKGEEVTIERQLANPNYGKFVRKGFGRWGKDNDEWIYEPADVEDLSEAFRRTSGYFVNAPAADGTVKAPDSKVKGYSESVALFLEVAVVSPMLFLNRLMKMVLGDGGYSVGKNFLAENDDLRKLILYNNYDITQFIFYTSLYPYLSYYREYDPWFDIAEGEAVESIRRNVERGFQYKDLVPKIQIKDFLLGVGNVANVFLFFRPGRKVIDIIDREQVFKDSPINISKYLTRFWLMGEAKDVTLKFKYEHDDTDMMFSERWVDIDDFRENEKEPLKNWDELQYVIGPEIDEIRYLRDHDIYVQYKLWIYEEEDPTTGNTEQKKYLGWRQLTFGFQNFYYNYGKDEEEEIPLGFGTLIGDQTTLTYQKGNSRSDIFPYESFKPRLLFYLGDNVAKNRTATLSLNLENEDGLMNVRWLNTARFWAQRQPVECEANFSLGMLIFMLHNIYKKFQADEGEFIIEELEVTAGISSISPTTIRGYKNNYSPRVWRLSELWQLNDPIWVDHSIDITLDDVMFWG